MVDRTTKTLLVLVAVGLWSVLLRPLFSVAPAQAQGGKMQQQNIQMAADNGNVYVIQDGRISVFRLSNEFEVKDGKLVVEGVNPVPVTRLRRVMEPQGLQDIKGFDASYQAMNLALWKWQQEQQSKAGFGR